MADLKMAAIIKLSENQWGSIRLNYVESESDWSESVFEWIWEMITRCLNPWWQCLNPTWQNFKMATIIKLRWEWMSEVHLCRMAESNMAKLKMAAIIKIEWDWRRWSQIEWVWVRVLMQQGVWILDGSVWIQHSRISKWLPSSSWVRMNEFESVLIMC